MKKIFYKTTSVFKIIPFQWLLNLTRQKFAFPFYHLVSDSEPIHVKHLFHIKTTKEFVRDLDFYLRNYTPVSVSEILKSVQSGVPPKKKSFLLTFDDGLREFNDIVAPILLKKGIPAVCFLNSGFIDNLDLFFRFKASILVDGLYKAKPDETRLKILNNLIHAKAHHVKDIRNFLLHIQYADRSLLDDVARIFEIDFKEYLRIQKPYLTSAQVNSLAKQGFEFGAHSVDHPLYSDLTLSEQINQTLMSTEVVVKKYYLQYKLFSFPFTDYSLNGDFFRAIYDNGVNSVDLTFGSAGLKKDSFSRNLQRIPVEIGNYTAEDIFYSEYTYYLFKSLINKNLIKR